MSTFCSFTGYHVLNSHSNDNLPVYIKLDSITGVFENVYPGNRKETVIEMANGMHHVVKESMSEVMKILKEFT